MEHSAILAAPLCANLLKIVYCYAIAIATLLRIANINSYGDKSFSELHAM